MANGGVITDYFQYGVGDPSGTPSLGTGQQWCWYQDTSTGNLWYWNLSTSAWTQVTVP